LTFFHICLTKKALFFKVFIEIRLLLILAGPFYVDVLVTGRGLWVDPETKDPISFSDFPDFDPTR
jgi:hypothetical protein